MIQSILDTDLYKLTMQQFIWKTYPSAEASYLFTNRCLENFGVRLDGKGPAFYEGLMNTVEEMAELRLTDDEAGFIAELPFIQEEYVDYLRDYRFAPSDLLIHMTADGLNIRVKPDVPMHRGILWEVPLMAAVSENYFKHIDDKWSLDGQSELAREKSLRLSEAGCSVSEFGTRRRRSSETQDIFLDEFRNHDCCAGTSNVFFAKKYGLTPLGTNAHELTMAISALEGLRHANRFTIEKWLDFYGEHLAVALTDTFGTKAFFDDLESAHRSATCGAKGSSTDLISRIKGYRHDSGCPFNFADKELIPFLSRNGIDPLSRISFFSDGLDTGKAISLEKTFAGRIGTGYGIGTHFTNDFVGKDGEETKPLNIVIKVRAVDGIEVVKLSDEPGKATGDRDAVRIAKHTFFGTPLDS